jgi:hypothetical protein
VRLARCHPAGQPDHQTAAMPRSSRHGALPCGNRRRVPHDWEALSITCGFPDRAGAGMA